MGKFVVLKKRKFFVNAAKDISISARNVVVQAAYCPENKQKETRVGFTATKRLGKAHLRNRVKRRMRAVIREVCDLYAYKGVDYVLIGRYGAANCPYDQLRNNVIWALRNVNKIVKQRCAEYEKDINSFC